MIKTVCNKLNDRDFIRNYFSFIGLLLIIAVFEILTKGKLLSGKNYMNIFNNFFSIGLGSIGVIFLMSFGDIDLSVGAILGLSAALGALASNVSLAFILPASVLTGLLIGCINGLFISRLHVGSFIGTLAVSFVARGVTTWLLNGSLGIPVSMRVFDKDIVKITLFIIVSIVFYILFEYTSYGKHCRAIGASAEAANQSGIKVERVRLMAFAISGLLCGLAGFFSLVRTCTASSKTGSAFEFNVLLAVLLGGMPLTGGWAVKFRSALIGSISMAVMYNGMSLMEINGLTQQLIQGAILIAVVVISFDRKNAVVIK